MTQEYRDFVDPENLMPLPTSDIRIPVCLEMKTLRSGIGGTFGTFGAADIAPKPPTNLNHNNNSGDMGSVDSTDTYASCNTHPYQSQDDLKSEIVNPNCAILDSNLYVNPLDKSVDDNSSIVLPTKTGVVKKSASGDTALRSLGASPMEEIYTGFGGQERGSRVSLNDTPLPKHRKTRFQQSAKPKTRFGGETASFDRVSQESLEGSGGGSKRSGSRKSSFMPTRSLASATRIINQHLFSLQTLTGARSGKNGSSKSSLSVDSIETPASPQLETHRRSKSILKKSDSSSHHHHHRNGRTEDPESERLISDNMSASGVSDNGGGGGDSDYSPLKRPLTAAKSVSPPLRHRAITASSHSQRTKPPRALPIKLQQPMQQESSFSDKFSTSSTRNKIIKSPLFLIDDILSNASNEKYSRDETVIENKYKEKRDLSGVCENEVLYICPPPPPMEDNSPTEETKLLLHHSGRHPGGSIMQTTARVAGSASGMKRHDRMS